MIFKDSSKLFCDSAQIKLEHTAEADFVSHLGQEHLQDGMRL